MALALRGMDAGGGLSEQTVMENELEVRLEWHAVKRFMGRAGSPRERGVALNGGSRPNRLPRRSGIRMACPFIRQFVRAARTTRTPFASRRPQ